jgi:hypothetical protein
VGGMLYDHYNLFSMRGQAVQKGKIPDYGIFDTLITKANKMKNVTF